MNNILSRNLLCMQRFRTLTGYACSYVIRISANYTDANYSGVK